MKNFILLLAVMFCLNVHGQDKFPAKRLTFDPAQEGFSTWSPGGKTIVYQYFDWYDTLGKNGLWKISPDGKIKEQITGHHEMFYRHLALSPDGSMLVYAAYKKKELGLWIMPSQGGKSIPLAITHPGHNEGPSWSPDGKRIAFTSTRSGNFDIWVMDVDIDLLKKELQILNK